ncbi:MAG: transposase domain-containing protein, partial [Fimbriimonadaceae bacterium]|nr:transposase domain-containing protein [Fimbriimonadaceae bacterium]
RHVAAEREVRLDADCGEREVERVARVEVDDQPLPPLGDDEFGDGALELDNGAVERAIRGIAIGRRNWLFAGSDAGAERAAVIYTIIESAVLHGHEPWAYMSDVLAKLAAGWPQRRLHELLPDRWTPASAAASP